MYVPTTQGSPVVNSRLFHSSHRYCALYIALLISQCIYTPHKALQLILTPDSFIVVVCASIDERERDGEREERERERVGGVPLCVCNRHTIYVHNSLTSSVVR